MGHGMAAERWDFNGIVWWENHRKSVSKASMSTHFGGAGDVKGFYASAVKSAPNSALLREKSTANTDNAEGRGLELCQRQSAFFITLLWGIKSSIHVFDVVFALIDPRLIRMHPWLWEKRPKHFRGTGDGEGYYPSQSLLCSFAALRMPLVPAFSAFQRKGNSGRVLNPARVNYLLEYGFWAYVLPLRLCGFA